MKKAAILIADDYEDQEFWYPYLRLQEEGIAVDVIGVDDTVNFHSKHGYKAVADFSADKAKFRDYNLVIIPGGWAPDKLRCSEKVVQLVRSIYENKGIVAAICHGGSLLVSAGIVKDKTLTSYKAIKDDLEAAGAKWIDEAVVLDEGIITSRTPQDLPQFMPKILQQLKELKES